MMNYAFHYLLTWVNGTAWTQYLLVVIGLTVAGVMLGGQFHEPTPTITSNHFYAE